MSALKLMNALWLTNLGIQGIVAVVLLGKGLWKKFPVFTAYCTASWLTGVALYFMRDPVQSSYLYWASNIILMFVELGVTYEIFKNLFAHQDSLRRLASSALYWSIIGLLILGAAALYVQPPVAGQSYVPAVYVIAEALRIMEVGLILALFLFSKAFGISWRQPVFGLALGLAILTTSDLAGIAIRAHFGFSAIQIMNIVDLMGLSAGFLVWLGYMLAPERVEVYAGLPSRNQLDQWNQAIKELIYQ